jgi:hypothetical protein
MAKRKPKQTRRQSMLETLQTGRKPRKEGIKPSSRGGRR